jgi:nucleoside phosphorylase
METSAVFQVCANNGVPVVGLRVVSDTFMGDAAADFNKFVLEGVQAYTPIVRALLKY